MKTVLCVCLAFHGSSVVADEISISFTANYNSFTQIDKFWRKMIKKNDNFFSLNTREIFNTPLNI